MRPQDPDLMMNKRDPSFCKLAKSRLKSIRREAVTQNYAYNSSRVTWATILTPREAVMIRNMDTSLYSWESFLENLLAPRGPHPQLKKPPLPFPVPNTQNKSRLNHPNTKIDSLPNRDSINSHPNHPETRMIHIWVPQSKTTLSPNPPSISSVPKPICLKMIALKENK